MKNRFVLLTAVLSACAFLMLTVYGNDADQNFARDPVDQEICMHEELVQLREQKLAVVGQYGAAHPMLRVVSEKIANLEDLLSKSDRDFEAMLNALNGIDDPATRLLVEKLQVRVDRLEHDLRKEH